MLHRFLTVLTTLVLVTSTVCAQAADQEFSPFTSEQLARANQLIDNALQDPTAYEIVSSLTTEVGPRLAGTEAEARARAWAQAKLKDLGFSNIRVEPFDVPLWTRGIEQAEITAPYPQPLTITALGRSRSTGPAGVSGDVVRYESLAALAQAADESANGKIVFVDEVMTRTQDGSGYGVAVAKRRSTAYEAHRVGAVAALIRSVGTSSHRFAHTGNMGAARGRDSAPTAALAAPDADQLRRALERSDTVNVKVIMTPETLPAAPSGNVLAEVPGSTNPQEIVLVGAHLDSWDLGTGAIDDGAGVAIVTAAAKLIMDLPQAPKRTIRVVLFGSEEVGVVGAKAYAEAHQSELSKHIVAAESDFGAGKIWRFETRFSEASLPTAATIGEVLHRLGIGPGGNQAGGGPDLGYLRMAGVPVVTLGQNGWDYFDLHHTPNDTLDKINRDDLAQNVAAYAAFIYLVANMEGDFR
jgi:hypothetical protein